MSNPKPEILYRIRGGLNGDRGVCNEIRAHRGVTTLRDRGFRTVRNAREPRHNIRDQKLLDLTGFVNAVFPGSSIAELTKFPMMVNLGNIKNVRVLTHDTMVLDMESTPASGVHPVTTDHYVREVQFAQYVQGIMGHKADAVIVDDPYTATWDTNYKVGA